VSKTKQGKEAKATTANTDKQRAGGPGCKLFACFLITIVFVTVITLICMAILFAEI
jgi:hypothetical protein